MVQLRKRKKETLESAVVTAIPKPTKLAIESVIKINCKD